MKDYKKILEGVVNIISTTEVSEIISNICSYIDENCPELTESKDERIRKWLVGYFNQYTIDGMPVVFGNDLNVKDVIAWLEKQGEQQSLYIRFGEIPDNEKSKIYRGEEEIGEEDGVSVYPAFEVNENIVLGLTLPITKSTLYTQQHLLEYENRPCYLVKGDCVGKDADGQPLICNIRIIKKIDNYRVKEEKVDNANNSAPKTEPTFLFKVNYNDKEYNVRGIFGDVCLELYDDKSESNPDHLIYARLDDCKIIKGGYGIKESGSPYPTKPATFYDHKSDCEHVGCHINSTKRWCHKLQSEVPYEKCSDKCPVYSSKQKPVNKAEPTRFHPGDWVVCEDDCSVHQIKGGFENLNNHTYDYELTEGGHISNDDINKYKKWTIEDAKDGDVLAEDSCIFIIQKLGDNGTAAKTYCTLYNDGNFNDGSILYFDIDSTKPATTEQRNKLEKAMKEAGWTFDFKRGGLIKITKFQVGDWVVEPREGESDILWHIEKIENGSYWDGSVGASIEYADKYYHTWTLENDGKDGEILVSSITNKPFIYNGKFNENHVGAYCGVGYDDEFVIARTQYYWTEKKDIVPATKEQRDFLFERMKEADYMWDFSNKKPVKIETK